MTDYRACPKCGDPGYVTVTGEHLCGNAGCDHAEPLAPGWESEEHRLRRQLAGAVGAIGAFLVAWDANDPQRTEQEHLASIGSAVDALRPFGGQ